MSKDTEKATDLAETKGTTELAEVNEPIMGFEDSRDEDVIIPRVKVINALSPECKDRSAAEGDILNSLTKEPIAGKSFIPVFMFYRNIKWKDRAQGGGMECTANDGRIGNSPDGAKACKDCKACEFDNTKQGKDAQPTCTKYINFFGFMDDSPMPIILSFARTNYSEGRKMLSIAKSMMSNLWNYTYELSSTKKSKNGNDWFIIITEQKGPSSDAHREHARAMFSAYNKAQLKVDFEDTVPDDAVPAGKVSDEY